MAECKKCGKTLWTDWEKDSGYCDHCRKFSNQKCSRCNNTLWDNHEKDTGICNHCRTFT